MRARSLTSDIHDKKNAVLEGARVPARAGVHLQVADLHQAALLAHDPDLPGLDMGLGLAARQPRAFGSCCRRSLQEGRSLSGLLEAALPPVLHIVVVAPNAARPRRQLVNAPLLEFLPGFSIARQALVLAEAAGLPVHADCQTMGFPSHLRGADLAPLGLVCTSPRADALVGPFYSRSIRQGPASKVKMTTIATGVALGSSGSRAAISGKTRFVCFFP